MLDYHEVQARNSQWKHTQVRNLEVEPLDAKSPYFGNTAAFAGGISEEAVKDTSELMENFTRFGQRHIRACLTVPKSEEPHFPNSIEAFLLKR